MLSKDAIHLANYSVIFQPPYLNHCWELNFDWGVLFILNVHLNNYAMNIERIYFPKIVHFNRASLVYEVQNKNTESA